MTATIVTAATTLPSLVTAQATHRPDALALSARASDGQRYRLSYRVLDSAACRYGEALADQAVAADTRVGVLLSNDAALDCILTALGAMTLSAAVVPLSPRWADAELEYALTLTEPVLVVTDRAGLDRLASLVPDLDCLSVEARPGMSSWQPFSGDAPELPVDSEPAADLDRLASLLFTSGT